MVESMGHEQEKSAHSHPDDGTTQTCIAVCFHPRQHREIKIGKGLPASGQNDCSARGSVITRRGACTAQSTTSFFASQSVYAAK